MSGYVKTEKEKMMELAKSGGAAADAITAQGEQSVLDSSIKLFRYLQTSMKRCTELSNGQTFFSLQK
jgi:hypothetical protein